MSRKDAVWLASRTLSVLLTIWALTDVSYLPGEVHGFLRYHQQPETSAYLHYMHHSYLISLGFLITRIIGYSLMARWLYKCGPEVEELLLPATHNESSSQV